MVLTGDGYNGTGYQQQTYAVRQEVCCPGSVPCMHTMHGGGYYPPREGWKSKLCKITKIIYGHDSHNGTAYPGAPNGGYGAYPHGHAHAHAPAPGYGHGHGHGHGPYVPNHGGHGHGPGEYYSSVKGLE